MSLHKIRENIDFIDDEILTLLNERFDLVNKIIEIKNLNNLPILNSNREEFIYNKIRLEHNKYNIHFMNIYHEILKQSKKYQHTNNRNKLRFKRSVRTTLI
mgnify:CR=1 FL=1